MRRHHRRHHRSHYGFSYGYGRDKGGKKTSPWLRFIKAHKNNKAFRKANGQLNLKKLAAAYKAEGRHKASKASNRGGFKTRLAATRSFIQSIGRSGKRKTLHHHKKRSYSAATKLRMAEAELKRQAKALDKAKLRVEAQAKRAAAKKAAAAAKKASKKASAAKTEDAAKKAAEEAEKAAVAAHYAASQEAGRRAHIYTGGENPFGRDPRRGRKGKKKGKRKGGKKGYSKKKSSHRWKGKAKKTTAWTRFMRANKNKRQFKYKNGKLNMRAMGVAYRKKHRKSR